MKIRSKNIAAIAIAVVMALSGFSLYLNPGPIFPQSLEEELEQIQQDRKETQEKIEQIKRTESQYRNEVGKVEEQLLAALSELDGFHNQLSEAKTEVDKTTIELVLKEEDLNNIEEELNIKVAILNNRIEAIYKNGTNNILELLLKAEDFIDFISRMKLMNLFGSL